MSILINTPKAVQELVGGVIVSAVLLLWQLTTNTADNNDAFGITETLGQHTQVYTGHLPVKYRDRMTRTDELIPAIGMLRIVEERVQTMSPSVGRRQDEEIIPILFRDQLILTEINNLIRAIQKMDADEDSGPWSWIVVANKVLGILYLIVYPFIVWPGQGSWVIFTTPIMYLFLGGIVVFDIFLGDIFRKATDIYAGTVYDSLQTLEDTAEDYLVRKYVILSGGTRNIEFIERFMNPAKSSKSS
jgi:hypothetical protein